MKLRMKISGSSAKYGTWKPKDIVDMDEAEAMRFVAKDYAVAVNEDPQTFEDFCNLTVKKNKVKDFKLFAKEKAIDLGEAETKQQMFDAIKNHFDKKMDE